MRISGCSRAVDLTLLIQNLINALSLGSLYALFALGIALIFGIMRLINLAHGELVLIGGYTMLVLGTVWWPVFVLGALAAAAGSALAMERIAFRPVRGAAPETLMVTSFAVGYLIQNVAILINGSQSDTVTVSVIFTESFEVAGLRIPKIDVLMLATTVCLLVLLGLFLKRTPLGVQMRAAAEDFQMASLLGVRANFVIATAFLIGGFLAGVVALLLVAQTGTVYPTMGLAPLLIGVVAGVLGGLASLPGAVLGGYLLGGLTVLLQTYLPENLRVYRDAVVFALVIVILLLRPQGLLGTAAAGART
jgi:branched-chain amino acid transport system permease protein